MQLSLYMYLKKLALRKHSLTMHENNTKRSQNTHMYIIIMYVHTPSELTHLLLYNTFSYPVYNKSHNLLAPLEWMEEHSES